MAAAAAVSPLLPNLTTAAMTATAGSHALRRTRMSLPAVLMRAGTSKGLFIHRAHLPPLEEDWEGPLLAAMGSRYNDARQLDGLGGATSVTSKVAVVAPSNRPGIDVDYTFVQVAVGQDKIDLTGNCGNMVSGVGPFAVQEKLVIPRPGVQSVDVRIFNTNTSRVIVETILIDQHGELEEDGNCVIPGVKGPGAPIKVAFVEPAGSMTGKMFPSGRRSESIYVEGIEGLSPFRVDVTLVDIANPFIFVDARTLPLLVQGGDPGSELNIEVAEAIRQRGAVIMGLAASNEAAFLQRGTPKLAIVSRPTPDVSGKVLADIQVQAYSMGKPHPSLQLTGGVCLASTVCIDGTVPYRLAKSHPNLAEEVLTPARTPSPTNDNSYDSGVGNMPLHGSDIKQTVGLMHPRGFMQMEVWKAIDSKGVNIERCIGIRTARRLFEGNVLYYI
ncbi:uncharacterized protein DNG_10152 [Cephalotrichum gorgonifer]|uniref:PrpF protein n=1 Tax=Cephalotrichum gorgonifer TaxID=2041049 RepID=A0AAE8N8K4_9PEZI|nr:uncharacterized protein DNG_10152 [Cephalotrichum gorgonifer]